MTSPTTPIHLAGEQLQVSTSLKKVSVVVAQGKNYGKGGVIPVCVLLFKTKSSNSGSVSDYCAAFSDLSLPLSLSVSLCRLSRAIYFCRRASSQQHSALFVTGHYTALHCRAPLHLTDKSSATRQGRNPSDANS